MFFKNFKNSASLFTEISQVSWEFISQLKTLSSSLNAFENHSQRTCFSVKTVHISFKRPMFSGYGAVVLSGKVCLDTFRRTIRKHSMLRALSLACYVVTISEHGLRFITAGKLTLSSFVTVEQVESERTVKRELWLCEEGYWRLSWKILPNSCFEDTIQAQAVRAPVLSRTGAREEFLTEARAESSNVLGQHFLACYQHPALSGGSEEGKGRCCPLSIQELEPDPMCTLYASSVLSIHSVRQTKSCVLLKFLLFVFTDTITSDKHRDYSFSSAWVLWNL